MSKKLLTLIFAVVIGFAAIAITERPTNHVMIFGKPAAANAAFRDGAYLGKLDAREGKDPHVSVGRWSRDDDRIAFTSGYQQSYTEADEMAEK